MKHRDFEYDIKLDGTVEIIKYVGNDTEVVIPDEISGYKVTSIGHGAFLGCENLERVNFSKNLQEIEDYAFCGCTKLLNIDTPDSITHIGDAAFNNTAWYNNHPYGDMYIGKFYYTHKGYMSKDTSIIIQEGIIGIADCAFNKVTNDKTNLTNIKLPNSLLYIGNFAFKGTGIKEIDIPNSVIQLGIAAFENCLDLIKVNLSENLSVIPIALFEGCRTLTSLIIPNSVLEIKNNAFSGCIRLATVHLPNNLKYVGSEAFRNCFDLKEIYIPKSLDISNISEDAFYTDGATVVLFCWLDDSYKSSHYRCVQNLNDFIYETLPDGTIKITACSSDKEIIYIPREIDGIKVSSIGDWILNYRVKVIQ